MQTIHLPEALRDRDWARAGLVTLAMLLAAVTVFATAQARQLAEANARLDAVAQKAFYETCELTEGLAVNFRKLLVAGEAGQRQALLNEAALQAQGAMSNLALLPLQQDTVSATLKFINQAGDFSQALSEKLASGGSVTPEDRATLESLSEAAASFSVGLARLLDRYERGEAVFTEDIADDATLYPLTNPAGEYPVLLYDGPFSDGRTDGDYRTLEGLPEVTESQARAALAAFIGSQQPLAIVLTGEGNAPVACYEYEVRYGDYRMSAGVTKRGGQTLYLLCESDVEEVSLSPAEAVDAAEAFLISRGYGPAEMSYYSQFGGILTVNFAPVLNGVVVYPDLVKVQVSLRDGTVIVRRRPAPGHSAHPRGRPAVRHPPKRRGVPLLRGHRHRRHVHLPRLHRRHDRRRAGADGGGQRWRRGVCDVTATNHILYRKRAAAGNGKRVSALFSTPLPASPISFNEVRSKL